MTTRITEETKIVGAGAAGYEITRRAYNRPDSAECHYRIDFEVRTLGAHGLDILHDSITARRAIREAFAYNDVVFDDSTRTFYVSQFTASVR